MRYKFLLILLLLSLVNSYTVLGQENQNLIQTLKSRYKYGYHEASVKYLQKINCYSISMATDNVVKYVDGLCDYTGKELIPPKYDLIFTFYLEDYSFCEIKVGDKFGVYSVIQGQEIVPPIYDEIKLDHKESYKGEINDYPKFYVKKNNKWGLYCSLEGEIIPTKYDSIEHNETFECKVSSGGKKTIFDLISKKEIFPIKYDNIEKLKYFDDLVIYRIDGKYGIISITKQQELTQPKYDFVYSLSTGFIECKYNRCKCLLDSIGNEIIPPKYSDISIVGDSVAIVIDEITFDDKYNITHNGKWGAYNLRNGQLIIEPKYDYISRDITENIIRCNVGGNPNDRVTVTGGLWGCIDFAGNEIIPFIYEAIGRFNNGVAQVKTNGAIGLIENPLSGTALQFDTNKISPVDTNIPINEKINKETFAFIIANENYPKFDASYSRRDGEMMSKYCEKRLGIPKKNIMVYNDVTYGVLQSILSHCYDIADVYDGEASIILYFSGIGFTKPGDNDSFILPVDVSLTNIKSTSLSINELASYFKNLNVSNFILITDCPFSGVDRAGNYISEDRGVALRHDLTVPIGEMIWISASHTSIQKTFDKDTQHGILTYTILDILQNNRNIALSDLIVNIIKSVKEKTLEINGEISAPVIINYETKRNLKI